MLSLQSVAYAHPNKDILFSDIDLVVSRHEKLALIGNNGVGKSTLVAHTGTSPASPSAEEKRCGFASVVSRLPRSRRT